VQRDHVIRIAEFKESIDGNNRIEDRFEARIKNRRIRCRSNQYRAIACIGETVSNAVNGVTLQCQGVVAKLSVISDNVGD